MNILQIQDLAHLTELTYLSFLNADIEGNWKDLSTLKDLKTFEIVDLSSNTFSGNIFDANFSNSLDTLHVTNMDLNINFQSLCSHESLQHLYLKNNNIDGNLHCLKNQMPKFDYVSNTK